MDRQDCSLEVGNRVGTNAFHYQWYDKRRERWNGYKDSRLKNRKNQQDSWTKFASCLHEPRVWNVLCLWRNAYRRYPRVTVNCRPIDFHDFFNGLLPTYVFKHSHVCCSSYRLGSWCFKCKAYWRWLWWSWWTFSEYCYLYQAMPIPRRWNVFN